MVPANDLIKLGLTAMPRAIEATYVASVSISIVRSKTVLSLVLFSYAPE